MSHVVLDDRDNASYQRLSNHLLALQPGILGVIQLMHMAVSHDGFRTGGNAHCITSLGVTLTYHMLNGDATHIALPYKVLPHRKAVRCADLIHHTDTAVNQLLCYIQVGKDLEHAFTAFLVYGKAVRSQSPRKRPATFQMMPPLFIGPF